MRLPWPTTVRDCTQPTYGVCSHPQTGSSHQPMRSPELSSTEKDTLAALEPRLGPVYVRQRLGLERDYEASGSRQRIHRLNSDNRHLQGLIRSSLKLVGLHARGRHNALAIQV